MHYFNSSNRLISINTLVTHSLTLALTLPLTLTISFALCADVVAEHGAEDEVLFGRELVQRTGDDEPNGLQTLSPPEIHVQILLPGWLQQVRDALTLQSLYSQFAVLLVAGEQHHLAHTFLQFVDVVHQHLEFHRSCCCRRSCLASDFGSVTHFYRSWFRLQRYDK